MQTLSISDIIKICYGEQTSQTQTQITEINTDSRISLTNPPSTLYVALKGINFDGHQFINELYVKGVRAFIVSSGTYEYPEAIFVYVQDTLRALQQIAAFNRSRFSGIVIAITGSNGKTIVKEWLNYLLRDEFKIVRSPKSYNSQVGVALSLLLIDNRFNLAIIEAGISEPGEMQHLETMIKPNIGIYTGIGSAHQENFASYDHKIREKFLLFRNCAVIIATEQSLKSIEIKQYTHISAFTDYGTDEIRIPFTDTASRLNAETCAVTVKYLSANFHEKIRKFETLPVVEMRMENREGINRCRIINDAYSADLNALEIALNAVNTYSGYKKRTVILSDFFGSGYSDFQLYERISQLLSSSDISRLYGIGTQISQYSNCFSNIGETFFFAKTEQFLKTVSESDFEHELILLKGAREYRFEQIADFLQLAKHSTKMEINMQAMLNNLNYFKRLILPKTKLLVMVKAFSYGNGLVEIAQFLERHSIDYLGVAFSDEGVRLRKSGIKVPILVMNPDAENLEDIFLYNLETEVYNFRILNKIIQVAEKISAKKILIHLKLDTGMNRLGFQENDLDEFCNLLKNNAQIQVVSIFSHLAAADASELDSFSEYQILKFEKLSRRIGNRLGYMPMRHILNSSGIERFSRYQYDMVRVGIGLYGFSPNNQSKLENVATLKSTISQIKHIPQTETVGYSRKGTLTRDSKIAIVPVGYADGLSRALSNRKGQVLINDTLVPIVGNISMDMFAADVTDLDVHEGDEVIIFGDKYTAQHISDTLNTIPYEILTGISQRVKRVYYY